MSGGFEIGKCNELFVACRLGGYIGKTINVDGFDNSSYENLNGFELDTTLGYRVTF